jgi:hypothetical protein
MSATAPTKAPRVSIITGRPITHSELGKALIQVTCLSICQLVFPDHTQISPCVPLICYMRLQETEQCRSNAEPSNLRLEPNVCYPIAYGKPDTH